MTYQRINRLHAAVLWILLAAALYLAADSAIGWNLACWDELDSPTGQSACSWNDTEFIRWETLP